MIASLPLALTLTAAFLLTGGYALLRWSAAMTGRLPSGERTTELAHLLMSVSMLVMTWTWFGSTGVVVQAVLFTVFAGYFATRAVRRWRGTGHGCPGGAAHALMSAAMVWMLVSMPLLMTVPAGSGGGHAGHAGHTGGGGEMSGMSGMDGMDMGPAPSGWATGVTLAVCLALLVACGYWTLRALRRDPAPAEQPLVAVAAGPAAASESDTAPARTGGPATVLSDRPDAACHAVMSIGMVVMLAVMVAGW